MNVRLPLVTLAVVMASVAATQVPALGELLLYDRVAIQQGEVWRLVSGHLVHFTPTHLMGDAFVFGVVGALIERRRGGQVAVLYLAMAVVIGIGLFVLESGLARFGGLSGLGYGAIFYWALDAADGRSRHTVLPVLMLVGVLLKISIDFRWPSALPSWVEPQPFVSVPLSHLIGVLTASALFIATTKENHNDAV